MDKVCKHSIFERKAILQTEEQLHIDYDTHWKEIIANLFEDFISFFLPNAYPIIDFDKAIEFLERELHKIVADNKKKGKVINDKLIKVKLKDGSEKWILIHIEIQSNYKNDFAKRMFVYFYRIFDQYSQQITAIAIYTGEKIPKQYNKYEYNFLGTKNTYEFNTYIVKHAKDKDLLASKNPFSLAILCTKYLYKSKSDYGRRLSFKRKLIRLTKEKKYTKRQIINLLKFIDLILYLPVNLEKKFIEEIIQEYIKTDHMYILKSDEFSNQLHLALYGESWSERAKRIKQEEEERYLIEKTTAIQKMLKSKKLSLNEISEIMDVSVDIVQEIQNKL